MPSSQNVTCFLLVALCWSCSTESHSGRTVLDATVTNDAAEPTTDATPLEPRDGGDSIDSSTLDTGTASTDGGRRADADIPTTDCLLTAREPARTTSPSVVISGTGHLECSRVHDLELNVCLQWDVGGTFEDVLCTGRSSSTDNILEETSSTTCIGTKTFRTAATATVDGVSTGAAAISRSVELKCR